MIKIIVGMVLLFFSRRPAYGEEAFSFGVRSQQFVGVGLSSAASFQRSSNGLYLAGEASYTRLKSDRWLGVYSDIGYDFGSETALVTVGPRLGFMAFGLDGGLAARKGVAEEFSLGTQVRPFVSFGVFSTYYRYLSWPEASSFESSHQIGAVLRMPLALDYKSRPLNP